MHDGQKTGETLPETFPSNPELDRRFTYHPPKPSQIPKFQIIRDKAKELAELIDGLCPPSREQDFAQMSVDQAVMWANAAIARRE